MHVLTSRRCPKSPQGGGGLADMPVSELQRLVCEVKAVLPQSMLALALSG